MSPPTALTPPASGGEFLRALAAEGRTVIVSSHALGEVQQTADEVLILDAGRLLTHRPLSEIDSLEDAFLTLTDRKEPVAWAP